MGKSLRLPNWNISSLCISEVFQFSLMITSTLSHWVWWPLPNVKVAAVSVIKTVYHVSWQVPVWVQIAFTHLSKFYFSYFECDFIEHLLLLFQLSVGIIFHWYWLRQKKIVLQSDIPILFTVCRSFVSINHAKENSPPVWCLSPLYYVQVILSVNYARKNSPQACWC